MDKHCLLLALVRKGPDEAAAAAVAAFAGDINACSFKGDTVLCVALVCKCRRPLTIAALVARGDCNPNLTRYGVPVLCHVAGWCSNSTATFLHFPTLDIAACDSDGYTPLHYAARWGQTTSVQLLLTAGADPTVLAFRGQRLTPAQVAHRRGHTHCTKLLDAAAAWHAGLRRGWLRAVVVTSCE